MLAIGAITAVKPRPGNADAIEQDYSDRLLADSWGGSAEGVSRRAGAPLRMVH